MTIDELYSKFAAEDDEFLKFVGSNRS